MGLKRASLFLIFLSTSVAFSAPLKRINPKKVEKIEDIGALVKIEKKILGLNSTMKSLKKKMESYEHNLNNKNNSLIKSLNRKKNIDELMDRLSFQIKTLEFEIDRSNKNKRKILSKLIVESFSEDQSPEQIVSRKILIKKVNNEIKELNFNKKQLKTLVGDLDNFQKEYQSLAQTERVLSETLRSLELEKQKLAKDFLDKRSEKEKLEGKYNKLKTQFVVGINPGQSRSDYSIPIEQYVKMEYKNKGITFFFRKESPVLSPKEGKVSYSGRLSTYGNVVIVDHGKEMRSVILGNFIPKIKKGMKVNKGQLIGYSKSTEDDLGKIYFEVRQKDQVQNTIYLVEKKFLSQDKSNKI